MESLYLRKIDNNLLYKKGGDDMYFSPRKKKNDSSELIFTICKENINIQMQQRSSLESKANTLIGFAGAMFALLISVLDKILKFDFVIQQIIIIGVLLFSISILISIFVNLVSRYYFYPNSTNLFTKYISKKPEITTIELIKRFNKDIVDNDKKLESKAFLIKCATAFQAVGFFSLAFSLYLSMK